MEFENLEAELVGIFKEQLGERDIKPESRLSELGMDSLDFVEIVLGIETKYQIALPDQFQEKLHEYTRTRPNERGINDPTIRDMADYIRTENREPTK